MYKNSGTNLSSLKPEQVKEWINSFDTVLADCDGVLWVYDNILSGSPDVINRFKSSGKEVFFVTNNSTKTRPEFAKKAINMGFNVTEDNIISTAYLAAQYLKHLNFDKKVYIIGSTGITQELDAIGIRHSGVGPDVINGSLSDLIKQPLDPEIGAVIVGFDEHFSFPKMLKAGSYLHNPNVIFIATNTDERFPMPNYIIPGTGSIVKAIETCAERQPIVMGKPFRQMCDIIEKNHNLIPERTLMIGDRCNTDILLGKNCGFQTLLVETGIHRAKDIQEFALSGNEEIRNLVPDVYTASLGDLLNYM